MRLYHRKTKEAPIFVSRYQHRRTSEKEHLWKRTRNMSMAEYERAGSAEVLSIRLRHRLGVL